MIEAPKMKLEKAGRVGRDGGCSRLFWDVVTTAKPLFPKDALTRQSRVWMLTLLVFLAEFLCMCVCSTIEGRRGGEGRGSTGGT